MDLVGWWRPAKHSECSVPCGDAVGPPSLFRLSTVRVTACQAQEEDGGEREEIVAGSHCEAKVSF